jgi:hypothetical protein
VRRPWRAGHTRAVSEPELLELGVDRGAEPRRRLWWVLLAAGAVVASSAVLVDRVLRDHADDQVAACADRVSAAVELEGRRVRATYDYVRFAAGLVDAQGHLEGLYLQIAQAARQSSGEIPEARDSCTSIAFLPHHDALRDRRDRCVTVLDTQRSRLAAVAADGRSVAAWLDAPRSC